MAPYEAGKSSLIKTFIDLQMKENKEFTNKVISVSLANYGSIMKNVECSEELVFENEQDIGGITTVAGLGTGLFASAEYQEAFTGSNWILDAGMSEEWYNGLMLATAAIATAGTVASMDGVIRYQKFGNSNWYSGWRKMRSHFKDHGKPQMGYRNVFDYTNGAKAIINNGGVYASKVNAYAQWISGNKYFFVGVGQDSNLITTYYIRTIKYAKYLSML